METSQDMRTAEQGGFIASTISSDCSSTRVVVNRWTEYTEA